MFYVLLHLAKKFGGENAAEDARKYQSEGGVIITFAENWNFELKFFLVNSFREKMTSR